MVEERPSRFNGACFLVGDAGNSLRSIAGRFCGDARVTVKRGDLGAAADLEFAGDGVRFAFRSIVFDDEDWD